MVKHILEKANYALFWLKNLQKKKFRNSRQLQMIGT